jgi:hypothetical protein
MNEFEILGELTRIICAATNFTGGCAACAPSPGAGGKEEVVGALRR